MVNHEQYRHNCELCLLFVTSAIIIIGEQPSSVQWIGAGLVILSTYFANRLKA
jgi:drug/metabolite transporter (DMT)-like permease